MKFILKQRWGKLTVSIVYEKLRITFVFMKIFYFDDSVQFGSLSYRDEVYFFPVPAFTAGKRRCVAHIYGPELRESRKSGHRVRELPDMMSAKCSHLSAYYKIRATSFTLSAFP